MHRYSACLIVAIAITFVSCSSQEESAAVPSETLVDLLSELHLADSRMLLDAESPDSLRSLILLRHGVTEAELELSLKYLSEHPDELSELYSIIVDRLVEDGS